MMNIVKRFNDNSYYAYTHGNFDDYQVVYVANGKSYYFKDRQYLARLKYLASVYGTNLIYRCFLGLYHLVSNNAQASNNAPYPTITDLNKITTLASLFNDTGKDSKASCLSIEKLFVCFYLAMIAEFHWKGTKLYHRLKHLAVYQVLFLNMTPLDASNFSKHKSFQQLNSIMLQYHI